MPPRNVTKGLKSRRKQQQLLQTDAEVAVRVPAALEHLMVMDEQTRLQKYVDHLNYYATIVRENRRRREAFRADPLQLVNFVKEFEALALRQSLDFRVENDVFVLMPRSEVDDQWFSRLLMLRDEHSTIHLAEFTGCREEFNEKMEHWLKADFSSPEQLMEALNTKCVKYFQQSQSQQQQQALQS